MHIPDESISGFAHSSFKMVPAKKVPLFISTKNTILMNHDGGFEINIIHHSQYKPLSDDAAIYYEHRLINDMVAPAVEYSGGFVWSTKNYDGGAHSDILARKAELITPDGQVIEFEAAHRTWHYREYQKGSEWSINPVVSIFACVHGLLCVPSARPSRRPAWRRLIRMREYRVITGVYMDAAAKAKLSSILWSSANLMCCWERELQRG
ncbi:hypothetical protein R3P38DRAFT_3244298 [Favolaschia claudopus]|uniref:Uncharacterized protein n=1 Tax=Favolaschia claudopus TaxID=2862362 RepID=A0AAV9Z1V6_9AGAR